VRELALRLTRDKSDAAAKVDAVAKWLQATHSYTTDLKRDTSIPDPLEDFLFHQSAGHCEYFASAAAILLRLGGVPTRYVNGFLVANGTACARPLPCETIAPIPGSRPTWAATAGSVSMPHLLPAGLHI